jgi:hypothetical protein
MISIWYMVQPLKHILIQSSRTPCSMNGESLLGKSSGNVHPRTGYESSERESRYSSTLSLTSALDAGGGSTLSPGRFNLGKKIRHRLYSQQFGLQ